MGDQIQHCTDQLKRTYRQSLDVILPFTSHETVVYCSDEEFKNFLKDKYSLKDLQVCIYLLERHIDLQQGIIQGLTHLQEIHKYDERSTEYGEVLGKLIDAQARLAVLRSRTVRCLTKQIQQRCGNAHIQLPPWSEENVKKRSPSSVDESLTKNSGAPLPHIDDVFPTNNGADASPHGVQEVVNHLPEMVYRSLSLENKDKLSENVKENLHKTDVSSCPKSESPINNKANVDSHSNNIPVQDNTIKANTPSQENIGTQVNRHLNHEEILSNSSDDRSVEKRPDQSSKQNEYNNLTPSQPKIQSHSNSYGRHVVDPVDETLTIETIETGVKNEEKDSSGELAPERESLKQIQNTKVQQTVIERADHHQGTNIEEMTPDQLVADARVNTINWDPSTLIKEILGDVREFKSNKVEEDVYSEEIQMAGYLEKLPVNKKKASLMKNWRKRYFKIINGKLFYFEDHRSATPISFIKLTGCEVKDIGNKCLEIVESLDYGAKLVVLRSSTSSELQHWKTALISQSTQKANRSNFELQPEENSVIIIDFGSSSIKAGFLQDEAWPQVLIPSVYAVNKENSKNISYGYEALVPSVRYNSKLVYPLRSAVTVGKSLDPNELIGFLEVIFRKLNVDPSQYKVIMTIPVNLTEQDKDRFVEILLDCFQVAGVYMTSQAILSMYSYSATSGIVVNIGDNMEIVPVEDGYVIASGVRTLPYGGRQVTDHFVRILSSSGHRYFSEIEHYIGEYLKIKTCYISQDFEKEAKGDLKNVPLSSVVDMSRFNLPNGDKLVTVGKGRFTAFEGFFKPELWGKDTASLHDLVYQAVMACSIDNRKDLCRNIYLSGATTKVEGFAERLQTELNSKFPSSVPVQVHASEDRQFAAFIGAAVLASLHTFNDMCITREEWEGVGPDILRKWDNDI